MLGQKIRDRTARICIVGLGYVGLPTAIHFSEQGFNVIGADIDEIKIDNISKAKIPNDGLNLENRLRDVYKNNKFEVTTDIPSAVSSSDIVLIIVPTPVTAANEPDLSYVKSASEGISNGLKNGQLIILESTTYPGTTEEIVKPMLENNSGLVAGEDFGLAYCPERYNPGDKDHTIEQVARIVGGITPEWAEIAKCLYQTIIDVDVVVVEDIKTAEAAKVIENIQRDLNIALFNELAMIFQKMDIDVISVIEAASTKWNFMKLYPGPGVGGHCLPVDPYYLTYKAKESGSDPQLILAGRSINNNMPFYVVDLIIDGFKEMAKPVSGSKIAFLGISYKGNTGDLRGTPAKVIIEKLREMNAEIFVHDPHVEESEIENLLSLNNYTMNDAIQNSDCVILHTYHDEFKSINIVAIQALMNTPGLLVDTRHAFSPAEVKESGLKYRGIGRGGVIHH